VRQLGAGFTPRYAEGYLTYGTAKGELYRQPFDVGRLQLTGAAERLAGGVQWAAGAVPAYDVSRSGALVYRVGFPSTPEIGRMTMVDRTGRELQAFPARSPWTPRFSPDGRRIVYGANAPGHSLSDLWVTDLAAGTTQRVTTDGAERDNNDPDWSPDGRSLVYSAVGEGAPKDMFVRALDRAAARRISRRSGTEWPSDWSPDGAAVLFTSGTLTGEIDIWTQPADGGEPHPYLATPAAELAARVSPDGRWVAYTSNETGRDEVYVQSYPAAGQKTLVSSRGGAHPIWHRNGRELYYWHEDQLIAATLDTAGAGEPLVVAGRTPLFRAPYVQGSHANYDVSPDGSRFVVVTGPGRANRLVVALHAVNADGVGQGDR
jgi:WD40 repeat protein